MVGHPLLKVLILTKQDNINLAYQAIASELNMPVSSFVETDESMRQLAAAINHLVQVNFSRLVHILYRLDVSEAKLKEVLREQPHADAGELIATMMVERQLKKMADRKHFTPPNDIPDDEKW